MARQNTAANRFNMDPSSNRSATSLSGSKHGAWLHDLQRVQRRDGRRGRTWRYYVFREGRRLLLERCR